MTDSTGAATSNAAVLTLSSSTDLGRLVNLSVRTNCGTGANNLIAGYYIGQPGNDGTSKTLVVRGVGPGLSTYGVPGVLSDPSLAIHETINSVDTILASDTGWNSSDTNLIALTSQVGAFPLVAGSRDSALVATLAPGSYSANIIGASGDSGITLAEVYDATTTFTPTTPRLVNLSARANVSTGAGNLIAGFYVGGSTAKTLLIRGIGPALGSYGVPGTLAVPTLAVHQTVNSVDTVIASNSAWGGDPVLVHVFSSVGAFSLPSASSNDCALIITLPPGGYTANLTSGNGASGVGLVEVYEIP